VQTRAEFGRIDTLVKQRRHLSCGGDDRGHRGLLGRDHNIDAKGVFFATQAVLPTMIAQQRGVIVSLASMDGTI
jgi:NADP-dependent 3-hydroxy acid dehydrogenase YdfG